MRTRNIPFVSLLLQLVGSLEVATDSPCAKKCLDDPVNGNPSWTNASTTFGPNVVCVDSDFIGKNATKVGKKFVECQTCMQSSGWEDSDSGERDTGWFLFNNRAAADYCLFGRFAEESDNDISAKKPYKQCFSACNPIYGASNYRIKSDPERYDYCDSNGNYTSDAQSCIKCLYNGKGLTILGNIVATLTELCKTKPGKNIDFRENVYDTTRIKLSSTASSSSSSDDSDSNLSKGAIAGIVLAGLVALIAVLSGILVLLQRSKKYRKNKTSAMNANASNAAGIPNNSYQYTPVTEHKYGQNGQGGMRPISELATDGHAVLAELGPSSPREDASELGAEDPWRRH